MLHDRYKICWNDTIKRYQLFRSDRAGGWTKLDTSKAISELSFTLLYDGYNQDEEDASPGVHKDDIRRN